MSRECPRCSKARAADRWISECWLQPSAERPGQLVGNACGRYCIADGLVIVELDDTTSKSLASVRTFRSALLRHFPR